MEIRVLQYFLAVAREESISGAAQYLHLTEPTLSRQLKDLEDELGKQRLIRGNRKITLTEEGMLLRKRAEEIVNLVRKTESEVKYTDDIITGDIYIGAGETENLRPIIKTVKTLQEKFPGICVHIVSGDSMDILEQINKGLLDFGVLLGNVNKETYQYIHLPMEDTWGVLMRKDDPLSEKNVITPQDLWDKPLLVSRQAFARGDLAQWLKTDISKLQIAATYNLIYNASLMVDEGMGYAFSLDQLVNTGGDSNLCFRPLSPTLTLGMDLVWKRYQVFSKASEKFLEYVQKEVALSAGNKT